MARSISSRVKCSSRLDPDLAASHAGGVFAHAAPGVSRVSRPSWMASKVSSQGHHLGDRGDGHPLAGVFLIQHRAGALVDQYRPPGRAATARAPARRSAAPQPKRGGRPARRRPGQPSPATDTAPPRTQEPNFCKPCFLPPSRFPVPPHPAASGVILCAGTAVQHGRIASCLFRSDSPILRCVLFCPVCERIIHACLFLYPWLQGEPQ